MDFSKAKSLTIPEGNVTQIADASGRVLWSAVKKITVNVIKPSNSTGSVTIDGNEYTVSGTYEALESISVLVKSYFSGPPSYYAVDAYVYLNNTIVATAQYGGTTNYSLSFDGCSEFTIEYKNTRNSSVYDCYITTKA